MPRPLELCLEDLDRSPKDDRYVRCVAVPGSAPGLALDRDGLVVWMPTVPADCGLWVSADGRLIARRGAESAPLTVTRGGRSLEAPAAKPVVLRDQDLLVIGGRRLRVHVHGETDRIRAPAPLRGSALARVVRAAAAAAALSAAGVAGAAAGGPHAIGTPPPIEVRDRPPDMAAPRDVVCTVTSITPSKKGPLVVQATCPAGETIGVGARGQLLDEKGKAIKGGVVTVTGAKGTTIVGETTLPQPVTAPKVRFRVD